MQCDITQPDAFGLQGLHYPLREVQSRRRSRHGSRLPVVDGLIPRGIVITGPGSTSLNVGGQRDSPDS